MLRPFLLFVLLSALALSSWAQGALAGRVMSQGQALPFATVRIEGTRIGVAADAEGMYRIDNVAVGAWTVVASMVGFVPLEQRVEVQADGVTELDFELAARPEAIEEVVISGTMKEVSKLASPVPVEVYSPAFFKANPTSSMYDALECVNGVRPQMNCSICNTGDIRIQGLEGPYTMVLIDGMPIVSGLGTVYGLNGIPSALIERMEVVKGAASTLYGSEAVGGLINVITKSSSDAPALSADVFGTTWGEVTADVAASVRLHDKVQGLLGVNAFHFGRRVDRNDDQFTDMPLQDRVSLFNTWSVDRENDRVMTLGGRYIYEDRFGGDMNWVEATHRGGSERYGESIYTHRWEAFGSYQLPTAERLMLQFSANGHRQNSVYGDVSYIAAQHISFGQLTWDKSLGHVHDVLAGAALRHTLYEDNTPATAEGPSEVWLPGLFVQDQMTLNAQNTVLLGLRYDRNSMHGNIFTPRLNYKWNASDQWTVVRLSAGSGYRVANIFTEDHAALTGARDVVVVSDLNPERSNNVNVNVVRKWIGRRSGLVTLDGSAFYTHFSNKILPDYTTDPSQIIYDNLAGFAVSQGVSLNLDVAHEDFTLRVGVTGMEVFTEDNGVRKRQELTERFSGTWSLGHHVHRWDLTLDYTGSVYSPMDLPTQTTADFLDPRPAQSPWFSIQNLQLTHARGEKLEWYGGVKNLLNWTPWQHMPEGVRFLGNTTDPFETNPQEGELVFDPTYVYGPNQGIRGFLGVRVLLN